MDDVWGRLRMACMQHQHSMANTGQHNAVKANGLDQWNDGAWGRLHKACRRRQRSMANKGSAHCCQRSPLRDLGQACGAWSAGSISTVARQRVARHC